MSTPIWRPFKFSKGESIKFNHLIFFCLQVKVWFQNRRIKWRKQHLEIQQQRLAAIKQQQQRSESDASDDESVDSNNYSFTTDTNDNAASGFYKSMDNISDLENVNLNQYQVSSPGEVAIYQDDNPSENVKNENSSEII